MPQVYWSGNKKWFQGVVIAVEDSRVQVKYVEDNEVHWYLPELECMWVCTRFVWARHKHLWWPAMVRGTVCGVGGAPCGCCLCCPRRV